MKRIILVRHGSTDWVDKHKMHGITDIPLNEKGLSQAREVAKALKSERADVIYTSPLSRCRQTAEAIGSQQGLEPILLPGLGERNFGWLEGHPVLHYQIQDFGALKKFFFRLWHDLIQFLSGESTKYFRQRVISAWNRILNENPDGTAIVVAHILVFRTILRNYFGGDDQEGRKRYYLAPTGITEIQVDKQGKARLVRLNHTGHLNRLKD